MDAGQFTVTNGYAGAMGPTWATPTDDELEAAIRGAMEIEGKSRDEIVTMLEAGKAVRWCQSPNFYYDHSYGILRRKRESRPPQLVTCDCGHTVLASQRMMASTGTCCPDCYDRMS